MKTKIRQILLLAAAMLGLAAGAQAQDTAKPEFKRNEIGISAGAFPIVGTKDVILSLFDIGGNSKFEPFLYNGKYVSGSDWMKFNLIGAFSAFYKLHNPNNNNCMVVDCSWSLRSIEQSVSGVQASAVENYLTAMVGYQVSLKETETYSLYSAASTGCTFMFSTNNEVAMFNAMFKEYSSVNFVTQVTFLGINIGKKKDLGVELGIGTKGLVNISYNHKF